VTKQVLGGRRHFRHLIQVLLAALIILLTRELAVILLFWVYALGIPIRYVGIQLLRRHREITGRLDDGLADTFFGQPR
jgi:hypothetical protein